MIEPIITCPHCSTEIKLTESLTTTIVQATRKEYEAKVALERKSIAADEAQKAKAAIAFDLDKKANELAELQEVLKQRNEKLAEAQKSQADILKKQRELDDEKRELNLTIEKRVQLSLLEVREKTKKEVEDTLSLKVSERDEQIASMQRQILVLKRKSEQGSQQLQGEVLELELEEMLRSKFPFDTIEPVAKGESGADIVQHVVSPMGLTCGSILWESKRTSNWNEVWLSKLRSDQRLANATISILISHTLPKNISSFGQIDGVWISSPK